MNGFEQLFVAIAGTNPVWQALAGGFVTAALNLLGALAILVFRNPSDRFLDTALGFAAGVMLAASFTSLILPGIAHGGLLPVMIGIVLGALFLDRADSWLPHVYYFVTGRIRSGTGTNADRSVGAAAVGSAAGGLFADKRLTAMLLTIVAITLHNMPEGLAVGVGFGSGDLGSALALMLAIGIQNIPEGFAVAVTARNANLGKGFYAAVTGIRSGLVEIPLAVLGAALVSLASPLLPY
ncbi:MAG: ZIP family metal transporter, partial [Salinisphaera sp.]|nr:ZIP family metal transporter [Salinisphaera sp.]